MARNFDLLLRMRTPLQLSNGDGDDVRRFGLRTVFTTYEMHLMIIEHTVL